MEDKKIAKPSFFSNYKVLFFLLLVLGIGSFLAYQKYGTDFSKSKIFTQYPPITTDVNSPTSTDAATNNVLMTIDSFKNENAKDSTVVGADSLVTDSIKVAKKPEPKPIIKEKEPIKDIVEEEKETPMNSTLTQQKIGKDIDFFDQLIEDNQQSKTAKDKYLNFYKKDVVSSKTLFKLAAIMGKTALLNGHQEADELFEALVEEKEIAEIILCNRNGKIIYASNSKYKNAELQTVLPSVNIKQDFLDWIEGESKWLTAIPIYHTYGRIGTVIVCTFK